MKWQMANGNIYILDFSSIKFHQFDVLEKMIEMAVNEWRLHQGELRLLGCTNLKGHCHNRILNEMLLDVASKKSRILYRTHYTDE